VRDAINVSKNGRPVVLFVYNHFERAARAQANGLGAPDLKIYVFPQYKPGEAYSPEEAEKAVKAAAEFPELLLGKNAVSCHDPFADVCGVIDGPKDLSTNPKHLSGFGE
jgi:hypothetical protein